jgi:hypothetical protein
MPPDRPHDVSNLTAGELARARRDLMVSFTLSMPGSPVRVSIVHYLCAIDAELDRRAGWDHGRTITIRSGPPRAT